MDADMNDAGPLGLEQNIAPSFDGSEGWYLFALFGLLMVTLMALNWLWRELWCALKDDVHPWNHPVTLWRGVKVGFLVAALMRGSPDAVLLMQWPEMTVDQRLTIAGIDRIMDGWAFVPFGLAFMIDYLGSGVMQHQMKRLPPPPVDLWPSKTTVKDSAKIAAGCLAIAFAVVFLQ